MSIEENKEIVRRCVMARNENDLDLALSVWGEEWHDRLKAGFNAITDAFPDLHIAIEDIFGEGDRVALSSTLRATHGGMYQNIPPTQKQITLSIIDIYTIENGKIKSIKRRADDLGLLKQMGVSLSWQGTVIT
jgi:predicted ester cyclase